MKNGTRPTKPDHRDYCYHQTFGSVAPPQFPDLLNVDAGLTMPNQMVEDTEFTPPVPAIPEGCTDEAGADATTDQTGIIHSPIDLEAITHANALGGVDIRIMLKAGIKLGWFKAFLNVRAIAPMDSFDSISLAILVGLTSGEKRPVIIGTPWFNSWEIAAQAGKYLMPMPTPDEIRQVATNPDSLPWHCWIIPIRESVMGQGVLNLSGKSWQGKNVGKNGWIGFDRATMNVVMGINGSAAYSVTQSAPANIQTINLPFLQWLVSIIKNVLGIQ